LPSRFVLPRWCVGTNFMLTRYMVHCHRCHIGVYMCAVHIRIILHWWKCDYCLLSGNVLHRDWRIGVVYMRYVPGWKLLHRRCRHYILPSWYLVHGKRCNLIGYVRDVHSG
jgi:hypothetical protein